MTFDQTLGACTLFVAVLALAAALYRDEMRAFIGRSALPLWILVCVGNLMLQFVGFAIKPDPPTRRDILELVIFGGVAWLGFAQASSLMLERIFAWIRSQRT